MMLKTGDGTKAIATRSWTLGIGLLAVLCAGGCEDGSAPEEDVATEEDTGTDTEVRWDTEKYEYMFQDPEVDIEHRVDNIVSLMTVDEKFRCLDTRPNVPRLGIVTTGHIEGLHGVAFGGPGDWNEWSGSEEQTTTQYPQAYGLGETWDPALLKRAAEAEAIEARYLVHRIGDGSLVMRAPNADLARDPRWGRTEESFGEDPFLTGTMTVAMVRGLQGDDPRYLRVASLMKHFLANSNEAIRNMSSSDFNERLLREYYTVPFRMGIVEGNAQAFMTAYNLVNDIPCTVHPILRDIAIEEWGHDGIICTDGGALNNLTLYQSYTEDVSEGAALAVKAGVNQFLDEEYYDASMEAFESGLLTEEEIDGALKGTFRVMIRLGLLDPPELIPYADPGSDDPPWLSTAHEQLALEVTRESIVLLKNDDAVLPLDAGALSEVAVIGPRADEVALDWYSGTPPYIVTPLSGIQNALGEDVVVEYAETNEESRAEEIAAAADVAIVLVGNHPTCDDAGWARCGEPSWGKESVDREEIALDADQLSLIQSVYGANPNTVVVLVASFPFAINWTAENIPAIVHMTHNSQEMGHALADVLLGNVNPAGRLTQTWPTGLDQLPDMMDYDITNGRTYMYFDGDPLFPFGFGLSYTTFDYANLQTSEPNIGPDDDLTVSLDVTNTGTRAGDEVVQMYASFPDSRVTRPLKALKGFKRFTVDSGETVRVDMTLAAEQLTYWDEAGGRFVLEKGPVDILVGSSSADIRLTQRINVVGE